MKFLNNLIFKVTLSSMIVSAPAMITGSGKDVVDGPTSAKGAMLPWYSSAVIKEFVNYARLTPKAIFPEDKPAIVTAEKMAAPAMELRKVINEAEVMYDSMALDRSGLDEKAFEYAWRGYHNLLKRGLIRKKNVLSICDFSQSSCHKRMYVIDVYNRKLLYRTYVAHGQNSGGEYADSFSNEPNSFKSSLGFYLTRNTYFGHNGLSLRIQGVDSGYNDKASKRNIVLHGSSYASFQYMQTTGTLGTSLGCPAIPSAISPRIIRVVKNGSCIFIYHPTRTYLEQSTVING